MKIFVVSDTHGKTREFINIANIKKPDLIIHLGDYVEDGQRIENETGIKTIIVKGNGDYFNPEYNEDEVIDIEDKRIFITHGHNYGVRFGIDRLLYKGQEVKSNLILFGHTHEAIILKETDIIVMNPGSSSIPRGFNRKKTFGVIEMGEEIIANIVEIN